MRNTVIAGVISFLFVGSIYTLTQLLNLTTREQAIVPAALILLFAYLIYRQRQK